MLGGFVENENAPLNDRYVGLMCSMFMYVETSLLIYVATT
jgi:hypothetical protein